ncbi:hypothetical protein [Nonomuraea sp. NPDC050310]|uniref:hypothetical protein n=1 Tax=Nonomuraea sp. NPDC050310 TaxID=3154935 RepID=UPI0033CFC587
MVTRQVPVAVALSRFPRRTVLALAGVVPPCPTFGHHRSRTPRPVALWGSLATATLLSSHAVTSERHASA